MTPNAAVSRKSSRARATAARKLDAVESKRTELNVMIGVIVIGALIVLGVLLTAPPQTPRIMPNAYVTTPSVAAGVSGIGSLQRYCTNPTTPEGSCSSTHKYCQPGQLRLICDCNLCPAPLGSGSPCESFCNAGKTA